MRYKYKVYLNDGAQKAFEYAIKSFDADCELLNKGDYMEVTTTLREAELKLTSVSRVVKLFHIDVNHMPTRDSGRAAPEPQSDPTSNHVVWGKKTLIKPSNIRVKDSKIIIHDLPDDIRRSNISEYSPSQVEFTEINWMGFKIRFPKIPPKNTPKPPSNDII